MNKKTFTHIKSQLQELKKLGGLTNSGLSNDLQFKMKNQAKKRLNEIKKTVEKKNLDTNWLQTNFQVSIEELESLVDEM